MASQRPIGTALRTEAPAASATAALLLALCGGLAALPQAAFAEGFRNPPPGAFDLGRAGGRIADVDDSSAVTQNPANLVDIFDPQANFAPTFIYYHIDYRSPTGATDETREPWKVLPNFFASMPLLDGRCAAGLGVTVPYGISDEWKSDSQSPLRYVAPHFTELLTINVNPSFSVRICDEVSVGAGLDVMWSQLRFNQFLSPLASSMEGQASGDGFGFGGNAGVTWSITERQRLAATVRSPMGITYTGDFNINNIPVVGSSSTTFGSQINFPTIVALGYSYRVCDSIRLETDGEWVQFSRFKNLPINVGPNAIGVPSQTLPENWRDTFTLGIAGDWQFASNWTFRMGYQYYQTPVPDSTFSPTIPDANQNVVTFGINFSHGHHSLEAAYGLDFYDHRNITTDQNPALDGSYKFGVHLFAFSYRYSF